MTIKSLEKINLRKKTEGILLLDITNWYWGQKLFGYLIWSLNVDTKCHIFTVGSQNIGLVARCHSFWFIFTLIEQLHNIYIYTTRREPLLLSSLHPLGRGPPLGCRAEIRTQACRTASRCATIWATPHPTEPHRTKYSPCVSKLRKLSKEYLSPQKTQKAAVFFIQKNLDLKMI